MTLGVLLGARQAAPPHGRRASASSAYRAHIRRIFEITLLDRVFALHETPRRRAAGGRPVLGDAEFERRPAVSGARRPHLRFPRRRAGSAVESPATDGYRGVGRLVLGGLLSRFELPVDRVEDLLLAVESLLVQERRGERLHGRGDGGPDGLHVRVGPFAGSPLADPAVSRVVTRLVDAVSEELRRRRRRASSFRCRPHVSVSARMTDGRRATTISTLCSRRIAPGTRARATASSSATCRSCAASPRATRVAARRSRTSSRSARSAAARDRALRHRARRPVRDLRGADDRGRDPAPLPRPHLGAARPAADEGAQPPPRRARSRRRPPTSAARRRSPSSPSRPASSEDEVVEALETYHAYSARSLSQPLGPGRRRARRRCRTCSAARSSATRRSRTARSSRPASSARRARAPIVELRFFDGLTQSEIAARVGISQMHVSRLLRRALARDARPARGHDAGRTSDERRRRHVSRSPRGRSTSSSRGSRSRASHGRSRSTEATLADLKLAVTEACGNAVRHAYPGTAGW